LKLRIGPKLRYPHWLGQHIDVADRKRITLKGKYKTSLTARLAVIEEDKRYRLPDIRIEICSVCSVMYRGNVRSCHYVTFFTMNISSV